MTTTQIVMAAVLWGFIGFWVFVCACDNDLGNKPVKVAVGIGLIWPVIAVIYAASAILHALDDSFSQFGR